MQERSSCWTIWWLKHKYISDKNTKSNKNSKVSWKMRLKQQIKELHREMKLIMIITK